MKFRDLVARRAKPDSDIAQMALALNVIPSRPAFRIAVLALMSAKEKMQWAMHSGAGFNVSGVRACFPQAVVSGTWKVWKRHVQASFRLTCNGFSNVRTCLEG